MAVVFHQLRIALLLLNEANLRDTFVQVSVIHSFKAAIKILSLSSMLARQGKIVTFLLEKVLIKLFLPLQMVVESFEELQLLYPLDSNILDDIGLNPFLLFSKGKRGRWLLLNDRDIQVEISSALKGVFRFSQENRSRVLVVPLEYSLCLFLQTNLGISIYQRGSSFKLISVACIFQ